MRDEREMKEVCCASALENVSDAKRAFILKHCESDALCSWSSFGSFGTATPRTDQHTLDSPSGQSSASEE